MTYKKPTIAIQGYTIMGEQFSGDAVAYEALKAHKTAKVMTANAETGDMDKQTLVPFHAVKQYTKTVTTADAEKDDAYCGGVLTERP